MVLAYHVIFGAYGFWLPNDPRGSWSDFVGSWELLRFGRATTTTSRRSLASRSHDAETRTAAKRSLKYTPVRLNGLQARAIGRGFAAFVEKSGLIIWACSILPEHVHLVIARHRYRVEQIVALMKGAATRALTREGIHPLAGRPTPSGRLPKAFARREWKVFLDDEAALRRAIEYVQESPTREGMPRQRWKFVTEFDGTRAPLSGRG